MSSSSVKVDARDLKNVAGTAIRASKEQSRALASAGFMLQKAIKTGMKAQAPAGEVWPQAHPWTALGKLRGRLVQRRAKWGRTEMRWTERRRGGVRDLKTGKRPLAKLVGAVRYRKYVDQGMTGGWISNTKVRVGFLTPRAGKLAEYHASGPHTQTVTNKMRRFLFAAGLGISKSQIKIPRRRHVEPVYERNRRMIENYISQRVGKVLTR
jgi:hypothetical protein